MQRGAGLTLTDLAAGPDSLPFSSKLPITDSLRLLQWGP